MAKKTTGPGKTKPKSEAIPLGTKKPPKKTPKPKKQATGTASEGERGATTGEIDLITKRRNTVTAFLQFRDDMPAEIAEQVVQGMEPEEIGDLYEEASTNPAFEMAADSYHGQAELEPAPEEAVALAGPVVPEFTEFKGLVTAEVDGQGFAELVTLAVQNARVKNEAEKAYKAVKAKVIAIMDKAEVGECMTLGVLTQRYTGKSPKTLDPQKLLEKGVSIDTINACYKTSTYEDVRFTFKDDA